MSAALPCGWPFCMCEGVNCVARIDPPPPALPSFKVGQEWIRRDGGRATIHRLQRASVRVEYKTKNCITSYVVDLQGRYQRHPTEFDLMTLVPPKPICAHCGRGPGEEACDWIECAAVAPQRIYVAGPMTGYPGLNFPAFHAKAAELRALGYVVINPAEINGGADEQVATAAMTPEQYAAHWRKCMRVDITALLTCDGIAMLDGWTKSKGATLEHHVAKSLGLLVFEAGA